MLTGTSKIDAGGAARSGGRPSIRKLIAKYQRRFPDFDDKIISMYARGMTVREIQGHLEELYGIDVSPDLISTITDAVLEAVAEWQSRPLDACYPLVFFDAIRVKIRDEGFVRNKAVYIALGILPDGTKEILGIWIEQTEGAKFWLRVMNELKNRGVGDILIAVVDGLKGFPGGDQRRLPARPSFRPASSTCSATRMELCLLEGPQADRPGAARASTAPRTPRPAWRRWRRSRTATGAANIRRSRQSWRRHWDQVIPFFAFPEGVRRIIYTTNAIEALNSKLRRAVRTRGHFPSDDAAMKLLYLVSIMPRRSGNGRRASGSRPRPSSPSSSATGSSTSDDNRPCAQNY